MLLAGGGIRVPLVEPLTEPMGWQSSSASRDAPLQEEGRGVCGGKRRRTVINYAEDPQPDEPEELTREQRQQRRQLQRSASLELDEPEDEPVEELTREQRRQRRQLQRSASGA